MKRAIVLGGLLCLASIVWGADRSVLDQADAAFSQGRYDEAIAAYSAVIRAEPTNIRAYLQAGRAHVAKGRYDDAVAAFNEGLQQKPNRALRHAIYLELGLVYIKQGRSDEAITVLREATKLAPHDFHPQYVLGAAYVQKGLQREALAALNEALRLAKASPGGKEFVPIIEAMLRDIQPKVPPTPTPAPPEKFKLTVRVVPADSTVKLENSKTEYRPGLELLPGRYDLVVVREGYKTARQQVTVSQADVTLEVTLEQEKYKLTVQATPADSTIKFDNSKLDYRPGMEIPTGRYDLVVTREGYKPTHRTIIVSNADVTLGVALEMIKYKLTVQATPAASTIKFDNSKLEYRPGMDLAPGRYNLVVSYEGYKPARKQATISTADVTLDVELVPVVPRPPRITMEQESIPKSVGPTQSRIIIRGRVTGDSGVAEVMVNEKQAELRADGTFSMVVLLGFGENPIRVTALDINDKVGQETFTISRESATLPASSKPKSAPSTASTIVLLSPEGLRVGAREARTTLRGRVTAPDGVAEVTVNGHAAALESDGTFSADVTLEAGDNPIVVAAMDTQRHVAEQTFTIYRPMGAEVAPPTPAAPEGSSPQQPASTPTVTIQRYLTMEAPEEVISDQEFAIQVAFTMEQLTPEVKVVSGTTTTEGQLALSLPAQPAQDSWKIDVVMSAPDFTFRAGMNTSALVLPRQGDSTPAVFYLRAKPIRGGRQARNVYVTLWYRGAFLGKVTRQITIVAPKRGKRAAFAAPSPAASRVSVLPPSPLGQPIALSLGGLPPDLTVFLLDKEGIMLLQSPHLQPSQHAFSTPKQLADWLNTQYAHFAQEAERGLVKPDTDAVKSLPQRERRLALLRGVGRELY
jgi:predicted negative regulator of RcsB-dependent stress response